jgi:hypothetical protein
MIDPATLAMLATPGALAALAHLLWPEPPKGLDEHDAGGVATAAHALAERRGVDYWTGLALFRGLR